MLRYKNNRSHLWCHWGSTCTRYVAAIAGVARSKEPYRSLHASIAEAHDECDDASIESPKCRVHRVNTHHAEQCYRHGHVGSVSLDHELVTATTQQQRCPRNVPQLRIRQLGVSLLT